MLKWSVNNIHRADQTLGKSTLEFFVVHTVDQLFEIHGEQNLQTCRKAFAPPPPPARLRRTVRKEKILKTRGTG